MLALYIPLHTKILVVHWYSDTIIRYELEDVQYSAAATVFSSTVEKDNITKYKRLLHVEALVHAASSE
jgi:hypothetical protein